MARPTLFLIDGSSQMYRAYHAFRGSGLSNQEGQTTHAVYVFVTMLRKLIADHQPAYIAASFDLAGPTFRDDIVDRLQGQPRGDARRPRRADQLGAPGVRGDGRADRHRARLRGRRRDRHAGDAGRGGGLRGRDRVDRQGLLPARARRRPRLRPARGRRLVRRRRASSRSSACKPSQVVDVLALVGDTSDNVAGVPGIGKKGAIDLVTQFGSLDALLERAGELKPKQREALTTHREDALQSRELVTIRTDVPLDVDFESLRYRGAVARALLRAVHAAGVPHAGQRVRADRRHDREGLRAGHDARRSSTRWSPSCARPASSRFASSPTSRRRCARRSSASRSRRAIARRATCRSATRAAIGATICCRAPTRRCRWTRATALDRLQAAARGRGDPQGRPRPEVRRAWCWRGTASRCAASAFDSMLASYLLDATRPGHPLEETSLEHLGYKALTEEDVCGTRRQGDAVRAPRAGGGAELRRRARRPRAAAVATGWRRCS